ncbi:DUF3035 domain-containing protein [Maritimibacter sp. 55A14]|nr:DUF3035 domain-containing protein [Maritimibacter sp. 55A14]
MLVLGLVALMALSACGGKRQAALRDAGPDEFGVLPNRPLQLPENFAALPEPLPGAPNLADPRPQADAVAALGGNPAALNADGVPGADGNLVRAASRYGVASDIREVVAVEDARIRPESRRRNRVMTRSLKRKARAYRKMVLDPYAENERFRARGVATPSAPPARLR